MIKRIPFFILICSISSLLHAMSHEKFAQIVHTLAEADKPSLDACVLPIRQLSPLEKKLAIMSEISDEAIPDFIAECVSRRNNDRADLLSLFLTAKRKQYSNKEEDRWRLKALAALAAKKVIGSQSLAELQSLPRDIQEKLLQSFTVTPQNFEIIFRWLEQLNKPVILADGSKRRTQQPVDLSPEQYVSLGSVACRMHYTFESVPELVKQLERFSGHKGKIKIELARSLILSPTCELSNFKRVRLGWLLACNEQSAEVREALFEILVMLMSRLSAEELAIPRCFCVDRDASERDIIALKARLESLYTLVQRIKNKTIAVKELLETRIKDHLPNDCLFSMDYIRRTIDEMRSFLRCYPNRHRGTAAYNKITCLAKLLSMNDRIPVESSLKKDENLFGVLELLGFLSFSQIDIRCLFKNEPDHERKKELNAKFLRCTTDMRQASQSSSLEDFLTALLMLIAQGADLNMQDENGDTVLHHAIRQKCTTRLSFLMYFGDQEENTLLDLHRTNNAGISPAMELSRSTLEMSSFPVFDRLARRCGVTFSDEQLTPLVAKVKAYPTHSIVYLQTQRILEIDDNEGRFRYKAGCYYMNEKSCQSTLCESIELGWLLALKETKQERVDAILSELAHKVHRLAQRQASGNYCHWYHAYPHAQVLHTTFVGTKDFKALYRLVKGLREGLIPLHSAFDGSAQAYKDSGIALQPSILPATLVSLLRFSGCYERCLRHRKHDERLTETLLVKARSMQEADGETMNEQDAWQLCMLVAQGAELNAQDESGNTVIHYCILRQNLPALTLLMTLFKECIDFNLINSAFHTPLHLAALCRAYPYLQILLNEANSINLDAEIVDDNGYKALHYALLNGHGQEEVIKLYKMTPSRCTCSEQNCQREYDKLVEKERREGWYIGPPC